MKLHFCLGDFCEISKYDNEDKFTVAQYNVRKVLQAATSSSLPAGKQSRDCMTDRVCEQAADFVTSDHLPPAMDIFRSLRPSPL
jgi:hypothetical protein